MKIFPKVDMLWYGGCGGACVRVCVFKLCITNPWLLTLEISHDVLKPFSPKGDFRAAGWLVFSGAPILLMFW